MARSLAERLADWSEAQHLLRVRIYPDAFLRERGQPVLSWCHYPGLSACAVLDTPEAVAMTSPEYLPHWQQTEAAVLSRALDNSLRQSPDEVVPQAPGGVALTLLHAEHMYTSAYALAPERYVAAMGPAGAIVSLPCRDVVILHPLGQSPVMAALMVVGDITREAYGADDAPLSLDLFWHRPGVARRIGTSKGTDMVKAIVDAAVVNEMKQAAGRAD